MQGRAETLVDVANLSLGLLGQPPITTLDPSADTAAGRKLAVFLYVAIDEVQRSFYWHELIASEAIAAEATDHFDGRKRYPLPENCLRPLGVRLEGDAPLPESAYTKIVAQDSEYDYQVEGDTLISHATDVHVVYIKRSDDPTEWTSELLDCIYHAAAVKAAQNITQDPGIVRNVLEAYEIMVKPHARRLQSKYKTTRTFLPRGFSAWRTHR